MPRKCRYINIFQKSERFKLEWWRESESFRKMVPCQGWGESGSISISSITCEDVSGSGCKPTSGQNSSLVFQVDLAHILHRPPSPSHETLRKTGTRKTWNGNLQFYEHWYLIMTKGSGYILQMNRNFELFS